MEAEGGCLSLEASGLAGAVQLVVAGEDGLIVGLAGGWSSPESVDR